MAMRGIRLWKCSEEGAVHALIAMGREIFYDALDKALDKALEQHQIAATAAAGEGQE